LVRHESDGRGDIERIERIRMGRDGE